MMPLAQPFSKRHGFRGSPEGNTTVREDAPEALRYFVLQTAIDLGWRPSFLRGIFFAACSGSGRDLNNWSEYPNVWSEVEYLMYSCPWFKVYDLIEEFYVGWAVTGDNQTGGENALCLCRGGGWLFC